MICLVDLEQALRGILFVVSLAMLPAAAWASPPPPPPEYIANAAQTFAADLEPQSYEAYAKLFAADLHVFDNGRLIASDKALWLDKQRGLLRKLDRRLIGYAEGRDNILVVDEYDDRSGVPTGPGVVFDARFITRATRYSFGEDHLVHEIWIIESSGFWISARRGS